MSVFDKYALKKEKTFHKRMEIDITLYEGLSELANNVYDASVNKLVNFAIIELIENENIKIYERPKNEFTEQYNFLIRESSYYALEKLKSKYGLSIYKLVNIAIYNAWNSK